MTLVDTSAWIEFFRGRSAMADRVDELIERNEVALCGAVIATYTLYHGVALLSTDADFAAMRAAGIPIQEHL